MKLVRFQAIDAREDIGIPIDRVDAVALGGSDKGEMDDSGFRAFVGAGEEAVFPHQHPAFDCALTFVIVNRNVGIFEKSGERQPVIQCVVDRFHEFMARIEFGPRARNYGAQLFDERLRFFAPHRQPELLRLIFDVLLDLIQVSINVENGVANILVIGLGVKVSAPGMGTTTSFSSLTVFEQSVETSGSVSLNDALVIFEKFKISVEGQLFRVVEHCDLVLGVTDVGSNFAFADIALLRAILNFDGRVVCLDDGRSEQLSLLQVVEQREGVSGGLHPVALRGARNRYIVARKDFLLSIVGKSVVEFADNDFSQEAWSGIAAGDWCAGLVCCDDVLSALWAGSRLLAVREDLQASADHLELMRNRVADKNGVNFAAGTDQFFRLDGVLDWFVWKFAGVVENMFYAAGLFLVGVGRALRFCASRARVMPLRLWTEVITVSFLLLLKQFVQFGLHLNEEGAQLGIALGGLLKLLLQLRNGLSQLGDDGMQLRIFFSEALVFAR